MSDAPPDGPAIADMLEALSETLSAPAPEGRQQQAAAVRRQLDLINGALSQWITALGADAASGTDCLTLNSVRETLGSGIGDRLAEAAGGNEATVEQTWASMAALCADERTAITLLSRKPDEAKPVPDPSEPPLDAWMITLRRCIVDGGRVRTEYTRPDRPGADAPAGIRAYGLSTALAFLRVSGIRYLKFDNADGFALEQRAWLANSARKVFLDCGNRANLLVNATVCVPARGVTMYTHLSFFASGTCRIRFESFPLPVVPGALAAVDQAKAALVARYGLKEITEQAGGVWTQADLAQLTSALAKVPHADEVVLRGCTFVRKKAAPTDTEEMKEAGSYRFADRTITLLDAAFCADDYGFVGTTAAIGPYSHWTILHEVGHAVEKFRWEKEYHRWDTTAVNAEIARLEAQQQALLEQQIIDLRRRIIEYGAAQVEMVNALRRNQSSSVCLQAFVSLVLDKKVSPCTGYAYRSWNENYGEFFADAYSLLLNEPLFLAYISKDLHDWFATGAHRASW